MFWEHFRIWRLIGLCQIPINNLKVFYLFSKWSVAAIVAILELQNDWFSSEVDAPLWLPEPQRAAATDHRPQTELSCVARRQRSIGKERFPNREISQFSQGSVHQRHVWSTLDWDQSEKNKDEDRKGEETKASWKNNASESAKFGASSRRKCQWQGCSLDRHRTRSLEVVHVIPHSSSDCVTSMRGPLWKLFSFDATPSDFRRNEKRASEGAIRTGWRGS